MIDLRSDTVTLPPEEMKDAITNAELGDDVFSEDPTINEFEPMAAELMGMEFSLLVQVEQWPTLLEFYPIAKEEMK